MCGIGGLFNLDGAPVAMEPLQALVEIMYHRGPDDAGVWVEGPCGLAHTRLSIVDPSPAGHQPMTHADGSLSLVFNGEIYNHPELRAELKSLGHHFASSSDAEVLLHAYQQWGDGVLPRLNGMWAFSMAWSVESRTPFLDYRVAEFCMALPWQEKLRLPWTKLVLRKAMSDLLPTSIRDRRDKKGFPAPLGKWMRGSQRGAIEEILFSPELRRRGIMQEKTVRSWLSAHAKGRANHTVRLWRWVSTELWFRQFIDGFGPV